MSNLIISNLLGFGFPVVKKPLFSTTILTASAGQETRIPEYPVPRLEFTIPVNHLRMTTNDFQYLWGLYVSMLGPWESLLYWDPTDNYTAAASPFGVGAGNNLIATGDGTTTAFQLTRLLGAAITPLYDINGVTVSGTGVQAPPSPAVVVYLNGINTPSGWTVSSTGLLTFSAAPPSGHTVSVDFAYFWRVRFMEDGLDFEQFMASIYRLGKLGLIQTSS